MEEQEKEFLASLQQAIYKAGEEGDLRLWKRLKATLLYQKSVAPKTFAWRLM